MLNDKRLNDTTEALKKLKRMMASKEKEEWTMPSKMTCIS
jgi:hypothetical protein